MSTIKQTYTMSLHGQKTKFHKSQLETAQWLDKNKDGYVSDKEIIKGYQLKNKRGEDAKGELHETKCGFARVPNPYREAYTSYGEAMRELESMEKEFPNLCERVKLGESVQGRDIWALRITEGGKDAPKNERTGVVITGCHHAREWMTVEVPLNTCKTLLEDYSNSAEGKERLQKTEVWVIPVVNPDGLEFSRNHDNMWRKNRQPIDTVVDGQRVKAVGVDPNRNYADRTRANAYLNQKPGDKRNITTDDFEQGSDDPRAEVYKGKSGASEPEVQALLRLELGNKNIAGVLDYHSYGETVMYPWGFTKRKAKGVKQLEEVSKEFNHAVGGGLKVQQSVGMYATLGSSNDIHQANGIIGLTLETNGCFQPHPSQIEPTCERFTAGDVKFIDSIAQRAEEGKLPERTALRNWRSEFKEVVLGE
jgi:carboxypeptidase T